MTFYNNFFSYTTKHRFSSQANKQIRHLCLALDLRTLNLSRLNHRMYPSFRISLTVWTSTKVTLQVSWTPRISSRSDLEIYNSLSSRSNLKKNKWCPAWSLRLSHFIPKSNSLIWMRELILQQISKPVELLGLEPSQFYLTFILWRRISGTRGLEVSLILLSM